MLERRGIEPRPAHGRPPGPVRGGRARQFFLARARPARIIFVFRLFFVGRLCVALAQLPYDQRTTREAVSSILSLVGLYIFWMDVVAGKVYEGLLRLVVILALANLILPCLWVVPTKPPNRRRVQRAPDDEDEEDQGE